MPRRYDREFKLEPPLIIDEAQTLPELFPALRSMIDLDRPQNGRYILLRSVNPALVEQISESLAGRVGIDEDVIHKGLVVYMGDRNFPVTEKIRVVHGEQVLTP
jgi:hypothetical protein